MNLKNFFVLLFCLLSIQLTFADLNDQVLDKLELIEKSKKEFLVQELKTQNLRVQDNPELYDGEVRKLKSIQLKMKQQIKQTKDLINKYVLKSEVKTIYQTGVGTYDVFMSNKVNISVGVLDSRMDYLKWSDPVSASFGKIRVNRLEAAFKSRERRILALCLKLKKMKSECDGPVGVKQLLATIKDNFKYSKLHLQQSGIQIPRKKMSIFLDNASRTIRSLVTMIKVLRGIEKAEVIEREDLKDKLLKKLYPLIVFDGFNHLGAARRKDLRKIPAYFDSSDIGYFENVSFDTYFNSLPHPVPSITLAGEEFTKVFFTKFFYQGLNNKLTDKLYDYSMVFITRDDSLPKDIRTSYIPSIQTMKVGKSNIHDGDINFKSKVVVTSILHELWHVYKHQVIDRDFDHEGDKKFDELKKWLSVQHVKVKGDNSLHKVSDKISDLDDFADEYVADMINIIYSAHLTNVRKAIESDALHRKAPDTLNVIWLKTLGKLSKRNYKGYQNDESGRPDYHVQKAPPAEFFKFLVKLIGAENYNKYRPRF